MVILHNRKFINRVQALRYSILAVPSSDEACRAIFERTRRILEAHAYGLTFLTINRARLLLEKEKLIVDWEHVRPTSLSQDNLDEWATSVKHVASNLRYVNSKDFLGWKLMAMKY